MDTENGDKSADKQGNDKHNESVNAMLRVRGNLKLFAVTILLTQLLCALFSYAANALDLDVPVAPAFVFACASAVLVNRWLLFDARRAWQHAHKNGHILGVQILTRPVIAVRSACPQRWLVILYAELCAGLNVEA